MRLQPALTTLLLPLWVAAVTLGITAWLWDHEQQAQQHALRADFDFSVRQTAGRIQQRMASYEQTLRGVQGLFRATSPPPRAGFEAYVDSVQAGADFAGIQALAYAAVVPAGDAAATGAKVFYVAPATAFNLKALGTDPAGDAVQRTAMLLARDSGSVGVTARLPAADGQTQAGFMMFLPVYALGQPADTITARRAAITGWVYASVRVGDLLSSLYGEGEPGIAVRIHDGVDLDERSLMGRSGSERSGPPLPGLEAQEYIGFAGHTWTLAVSAMPAFGERYGNDSARIIAVAGIAFSALLALLTQQLLTARARARAHAAARLMTGELRDSEARYRRIVETADEGIWVTDAAARISFVNPKLALWLGYGVQEMLGRTPAEFMADRDADGTASRGGPLDGSTERREWLMRAKDGALRWASVATSTIVDAAGQPAGALAMVTDITEKKQADALRAQLEAQLRESQKMEAIGTLAGGIAHDFNNILAAILGNVALGLQTGPEAVTRTHLEQINKAAARARGLVQQILAFSRRQPHRLVSQPLQPLVIESMGLLRPILPALVELQVKLTDTVLHVAADSTQLQQVIMNLCINAWQALQGKVGRITVELAAVELDSGSAQGLGLRSGPCARLSVSDNGCGMDEATRARVFEPFFTTKPVGQGTGLGLAVVHGIVAVHHGAITVASTPGQGSRFDLYFPRQAEPEAAVAAVLLAANLPPQAGRHLLYVDDDPVMVVMVQSLLRRAGYEVSCFEDPRAALAALREEPLAYDLVISDYNMPGLSGLDLARELAALRPELPVVISSGYVSEDVFAAATQAGVRAVMQKEYTLEQLVGIVQRVLAEPVAPG